MKYALLENGVVVNTIVLLPYNSDDFSNAVRIKGLSVQIGDTYDGERFYHDGEPIYTVEEQLAESQMLIDILTGEVE